MRTDGRHALGRTPIIPDGLDVATALDEFRKTPACGRTGYRDYIIGIYLAEENARFNEYKNAIKVDMRQGNFLLDVASIGLASAASVAAKQTANFLSASSAAVAGTRASFNKQIYFEQTLNALIAQMNAEHDRVGTNIRLRMRETADTYSLAEFFDDLARLEAAGSIEQALQKTAAAATEQADQQQQRFEAAFVAPVATPKAAEVRRAMKAELGALIKEPPDRSLGLAAAAGAVGAKIAATDLETVANIMTEFLKVGGEKETAELASKVRAALISAENAGASGTPAERPGEPEKPPIK